MFIRSVIFFILAISNIATAQEDISACKKGLDSGYYFLSRFRAAESMKHFGFAIEASYKLSNKHFYAASLFGAAQATWYAGNFKNAADTVKLAIQYFPARENDDIISAYRILSNIYDDLGEYEQAFKAVQKALSMNQTAFEHNRVLPLVQMGKLYKNIGDLESAMHYYKLALAERPTKGDYPFRELHHCLGDLYVAKKNFDSAAHYYRQSFNGNPNSKLIRLRLGELHLRQQHFDSAYYFVQPLYREVLSTNDVNLVAGTSLALARIAQARGNYSEALKYAGQANNIASEKAVFRFRLDAASLLSSLNEKLGNATAALRYRKIFDSLKDAGTSDVFKGQLFSFRQKTEEAALAAEMQSLRDEKKIAERTIIIICLIAVLVIAIIVFRYQHIRLRLKQRAGELEMQALRAQMNPHFIFNCLSAINHFILDNQNDKASDYLTRFSRLVRMVLANAGKESIPLDEELDMLRLYLDMEQLRFKHAFTYNIHLAGEVSVSELHVPCFILQPFCENAIWHGLLHKDGKGHLDVTIKDRKGKLHVTIKDNGIGRGKAAELSKKQHTSMGQQLTASRLALFNKTAGGRSPMQVHDLFDSKGEVAGTEILLTIKTGNLQ